MQGVDIELFRERLRGLLTEKGISYAKLAELSSVSVSAIEKWLGGKYSDTSGKKEHKPPSLENIYKVSQALGVSIDYFVNPKLNCKTITNQMIHDTLGLSDSAIDMLKILNNPQTYDKQSKSPQGIIDYYATLPNDNECKDKLSAVNMLVSNVNLYDADMLTYIYLYLTQKDTENNHFHGDNMSYDANVLYRTALKDNMFIELQKLKDNIQ